VAVVGEAGTAVKTTAQTGLKYQCVEYARRYLFQRYGVVFPDVMGAVDIWRLTSVHAPHDETARFHLGRYRNDDDADRIPEIGSLLLYPIQPDMPFGHVAVIVDVKLHDVAPDLKNAPADAHRGHHRKVGVVHLAEQNYDSHPWRWSNHSREVHLETLDGEYYAVRDPHYRTFGWMTVEKFIKPLDAFLHDDEEPGLPPSHLTRGAEQVSSS
jgi:hypothetical protein